jgi:hypothetical protein
VATVRVCVRVYFAIVYSKKASPRPRGQVARDSGVAGREAAFARDVACNPDWKKTWFSTTNSGQMALSVTYWHFRFFIPTRQNVHLERTERVRAADSERTHSNWLTALAARLLMVMNHAGTRR